MNVPATSLRVASRDLTLTAIRWIKKRGPRLKHGNWAWQLAPAVTKIGLSEEWRELYKIIPLNLHSPTHLSPRMLGMKNQGWLKNTFFFDFMCWYLVRPSFLQLPFKWKSEKLYTVTYWKNRCSIMTSLLHSPQLNTHLLQHSTKTTKT